MQTAFAFPFKRERVFNMRDFEQGLDQMNRLQSNNITMSVEPTTDGGLQGAGYTDVIITNNQDPEKNGVPTGRRTTFLTAGVNNSGSKNTGENVLSLSLSQDNLISINDNIYLSYTDSSFMNGNNKVSDPNDPANKHPFKNSLDFLNNDEEKLKYSKSLYSSLSFPIGYWTINTSLNYSTYKTTNSGQNTTFHTTGQTMTQSYSLDKVVYRTQKYKLNIGTALEIRDTKSYIRDLKSDTGSRQTSSGTIYLN
ncbi:MAG: ShlB/FhaC/HecB family hemolysin secretion/activation protein, partial [Crenarchaeota archaeon]|nr:ShlB/FhaC/HecB family hemolysin secretion/activation protein [Thermoproteota archaeon]